MNRKLKLNLYSISFIVPLIFIAILIYPLYVTLKPASSQLQHPSTFTKEHIKFNLSSDQQKHTSLKQSQFQLEVVNDIQYQEINNKNTQDLITHFNLTLQMTNMNCGVVTANNVTYSEHGLLIEAIPLMQGQWIATAVFTIDESTEQQVTLQYPFEVVVK